MLYKPPPKVFLAFTFFHLSILLYLILSVDVGYCENGKIFFNSITHLYMFQLLSEGSWAEGRLQLLEGSLSLFFVQLLSLALLFFLSNLSLKIAPLRQSLHLVRQNSSRHSHYHNVFIILKYQVALYWCLSISKLKLHIADLNTFSQEHTGDTFC